MGRMYTKVHWGENLVGGGHLLRLAPWSGLYGGCDLI